MMSVLFSAKGVVETVKKLNWVPDIIHACGWQLCYHIHEALL
jgi:glycogen synthase